MHRLMSVIANSGLLMVVLALLGAPLLLGQFLSTSESGALGATSVRTPVAATEVAASQAAFTVSPNEAEFHQYAQFSTAQVSATTYQTGVTFTAFGGQLAAYNGLMTVVNTSNQELKISLQVGKLSGLLPASKIWLTLTPEGQTGAALVTRPAIVGSRELIVSEMPGFTSGSVVAGGQVLTGSQMTPTSLKLDRALDKPIEVGDKVYFAPAYFAGAALPVLDTTGTLKVPAGARAVVNMTVATDGSGATTAQAVVPVIITAQ